jgi:3-oxoacyl-[acyl-carrier protein] reductase
LLWFDRSHSLVSEFRPHFTTHLLCSSLHFDFTYDQNKLSIHAPELQSRMSSSTTTLPLSGKTALITGASKGIGASTALHLASLGAHVVVNYSSSAVPAEALVSQIGSRATAIKADVSSLPEITRLVAETISWSPSSKIDILIPSAAVSDMRTVEQTTEEDFDRTYNLNVKGPYFLVKEALPHMTEGGRVVLLSTSLCNSSPITPNYLLYTSSKGAIEQMTRILAKDLGTRGITVYVFSHV